MKKHLRLIAISTVGLVILVSAAYAAWYAWDTGRIGHNPRAPVAEAMEDAVRKQAVINISTRENTEPCLNLNLSNPQPEVSGLPGISPAAVPGRHSITLLRQTNVRDQPARDIQLGQLDYLSTQGFFTAADSTIETDAGPRPARTYRLTWAGYVNNQQNYGGALCFNYGRREYAGIENIEKLLEKVMDLDVYEVTYASKQVDPPAWVGTAEARRWFPKLQQLTEPSKGRVKVIRTREGWRSAFEVELAAAQAAKGQGIGNNYMQEMLKNLLRRPPTLAEARQMINGVAGDANWMSRNGIACLPLQLQRDGDDKPLPGSMQQRPPETVSSFTVTYYDRPDRKEYELRMMYKTLHTLSALEHAGLAKAEYIAPPRNSRKKAEKVTSPLSADAQYGGIRYVISREAAEALGIASYGGGCIPAGRLTPKLLDVQSTRGNVQVKARGLLSQTPDWAVRISEQLPALKTMIDNGVQMNGQFNFAPNEGEGKWNLSNLSVGYPDMNYDALPPQLVPLLPKTVAAFPYKQVRSPAFVEPQALSSAAGPGVPSPTPVAVAVPAPVAVAASRYSAPAAEPIPAPAPVAQKAAPFPAEGAPVHVISIYQAKRPQSMQFSQGHPEGTVNVKISEDNAVLLLLAYEPIEWHINADGGVKLKRVIAIGYYEPRVTFTGGGKPQVVVATRSNMRQRMGIELKGSFTNRSEANDLIDIAATTRTITDTLPRTFQTGYEAPPAGFAIGAQTPLFALPAAQAPQPGSKVALRSSSAEEVTGNKLQRGMSGAYTEAWSDRGYSAGKVYYEGKMKVTGSLVAHTHANIGLCMTRGNGVDVPQPGGLTVISHGEQKIYKEGDIFGIAADFDQHRLYFRVNGKWLSGQPGSGQGFPLEQGKAYRACVLAAGTVTGEVKEGKPRSDTTWEVNFGEAVFQSPLPAGYVAFNGSR